MSHFISACVQEGHGEAAPYVQRVHGRADSPHAARPEEHLQRHPPTPLLLCNPSTMKTPLGQLQKRHGQ